MINCPECDAVIDVEEEELDEGEHLICEECGAQFAVAGLDPLELVPADDEEFDEDEDEDEDYDEFDEEDEDEEDEEEEDDWR